MIDGITGGRTTYAYDAVGSLMSARYEDGTDDYRMPDAAGNVFRSRDRRDREYGKGGRILRDRHYDYLYDVEGNLILKTPRRGLTQHQNHEVSEESGTHVAWQTGDYAYEWYGNGMLKEVRLPYGKTVRFEYDALGRRTAKLFNGHVFRYLWDGNVMVQEWQYEEKDRPQHSIDEFGRIRMLGDEPVENLVTWVYEEGSYVPVAKIQNGERYTIISDYMGRPVEAYNSYGNVVWQADYDIYGDLRNRKGIRDFIPFRQLGQYEDNETRLYYNRFRYYDPRIGNYISQDPIRLAGNNPTLYGYVGDCNTIIDFFGFSECNVKGVEHSLSHKTFDVPNPYDDCFKGVKLASQYLREMGVSRAKRKEILESFEIGTIKVQKAGVNEYGIRFFGGNAQPMGQFLSDTFGTMTNRANLALPPKWNSITGIKQWKIKPETTMIKGKVTPQLNEGPQYIGGANQIFILEPWKYGSLS